MRMARTTPPAGSFVSVSGVGGHTCGVRSNGSVACWGWNADGRTTPPAGSFDSVSARAARMGPHPTPVRSPHTAPTHTPTPVLGLG